MITKNSVKLLPILLLLPLAVSAALPEPPPEVTAIVQRWLADPTTKAPGIAIVAVNKSGLLWSGAFGLADVERRRPVTPATRWQFASVTKVYTALILAQLVQEGRIDLDAPISRYLPELKLKNPEPGAPPLTLRHLATHSAGIVNGWARPTHTYTEKELLDWESSAGLSIQPGFQFKYANPGFALVGAALARVTGKSFSQLLQERIFQPFKLGASALTTVPPHPDLAISYGMKEGKLSPLGPSEIFRAQEPASSLVSTAEDVGRFVHAHLAGGSERLISEEVRDMLFTPYLALEENRGMGLGWFCTWRDNLPYWSHVGSWNNFYSRIVIRPDVGLGLAFSTNGPWTSDLIAPLLKLLAADADTSGLDAVAGDYNDATGKVYTVRRVPGPELNLEIKDVGRLLPMTRHSFRLYNAEGKANDWVRFVTENDQRVMLWELRRLVRR